ncbi:MAG: methanethiol S-methyltransferase [Gemmatimonadota bacterium]
MKRFIALVYGIVAYVVFFATFLYSIAFVGGFGVPRTVDGGGPEAGALEALSVNAALLMLFAVQHSVMARPAFKSWWTRVIPKSVERSTYVLLSSLALALLFWQWRPLDAVVWNVEGEIARNAVWSLFGLGWLLVLLSTFMISHTDLFGLRQVWLRWKEGSYRPLEFQLSFLYRFVRHPLLLGFIVAFWATPTMTAGHLLFAVATTGYILVGIRLEERDLVRTHGKAYQRYRAETPMLVPNPLRAASPELLELDRVRGEVEA